ncbi:Replicative DNA helicase [invertebrate metagenome]|uniref:DNA 5'-3' helicase n=1 Tax=invertebrate metagenome TaxID=1711999 RepID=A0A484H7Y7_9ZZZZ
MIKHRPDDTTSQLLGNTATRIPPHNEEAEQALLGAILVNNHNYENVSEFLQPEHFSNSVHGRIYALCQQLINKGIQADPITLRTYLEQDGSLAEVGGPAYLAALARPAVGIIDVSYYGRMIYDLSLRRHLIALGEEIVNKAFSAEVDTSALQQIEAAEQKLYDLATKGTSEGGLKSFATALAAAIQMTEIAHKRDGSLSGITTGFTDLNRQLGGLHPSDLIIIAARPAMGKTALATSIAFNAAYERARRGPGYGALVAFFSLEMSSDQLGARVLSITTSVSSHKMRTGALSKKEFYTLAQATPELERSPLFIDDTPGLTVSAIRTRARRLKRQRGLELVVIDYLQLLASPSGRRFENRVQELSEITRGLKILAKELGVPVVALSQLSRSVESRDDKRPLLSDLRESGSIEQDADVVMFIFREEYYLERARPPLRIGESEEKYDERVTKWQEQLGKIRNRAEVIVAKQRHGPTGTVELYFNGEFTEFRDLDQRHSFERSLRDE